MGETQRAFSTFAHCPHCHTVWTNATSECVMCPCLVLGFRFSATPEDFHTFYLDPEVQREHDRRRRQEQLDAAGIKPTRCEVHLVRRTVDSP